MSPLVAMSDAPVAYPAYISESVDLIDFLLKVR